MLTKGQIIECLKEINIKLKPEQIKISKNKPHCLINTIYASDCFITIDSLMQSGNETKIMIAISHLSSSLKIFVFINSNSYILVEPGDSVYFDYGEPESYNPIHHHLVIKRNGGTIARIRPMDIQAIELNYKAIYERTEAFEQENILQINPIHKKR